jgi:polar amino acid transport system substrate-binding protein
MPSSRASVTLSQRLPFKQMLEKWVSSGKMPRNTHTDLMTTVHRLFIVLLGLLSASLTQAQTLQLSSNENAVEQEVAALLLSDIYTRAGLAANIQPLPGKRANQLALSGGKDGETARIKAYADKNPTLLRIDPAFYFLNTSVFARADRKLIINSKTDLSKYRIGIVRGIAHAERAVEGLTQVEVVDKYEQLYRMIDAGRIDIGIDTGINGLANIHLLGLKERVVPVGDLARHDLHNILIPRHAAIAPKISTTIKAMQSSGELAKLTSKYEQRIIESWGQGK